MDSFISEDVINGEKLRAFRYLFQDFEKFKKQEFPEISSNVFKNWNQDMIKVLPFEDLEDMVMSI